jgi:radical SAM protein with 4Fe4S-binding SPASM domain
MDISLAKQIVEKYLTTGDYEEIHICLFGGEPLLEFEFIKELCEWTWNREWKKKFLFFVNTNGTMITDEVKEWTIKHRKWIWLGLSLDGMRETHNMNRSNSFDKIDLDFFLENWSEQSVKMTITDKNLPNLANDIIFIHEKGFIIGGCNFAEGIEIRNFDKNLEIIGEQLLKLSDYYLEHLDIEITPLLNLPLAECENTDKIRRKRCGTGEKSMIVIDIDGKIYPCSFLSSLSLSQKQLEEINNMDLSNLDLFIDEDCFQNCYLFPVCHGCYGDNFVATGNLSKRSFQKCELIKLRALISANYNARKILQNKQQKTISQREINTITAIQKINELFSNYLQ